MAAETSQGGTKANPRIVVVGSCASGKTTMVARLRDLGLDATVVAQEHSEIPTLWMRSRPDFLVLLEADLQTVRKRRDWHWPEPVYRAQERRLANARAAADIVIDTAKTDVEESVRLVSAGIRARRER